MFGRRPRKEIEADLKLALETCWAQYEMLMELDHRVSALDGRSPDEFPSTTLPWRPEGERVFLGDTQESIVHRAARRATRN